MSAPASWNVVNGPDARSRLTWDCLQNPGADEAPEGLLDSMIPRIVTFFVTGAGRLGTYGRILT